MFKPIFLCKCTIMIYLSVVLVFTQHIHYKDVMGDVNQNYITPFSCIDVVFFFLSLIIIYFSSVIIRKIINLISKQVKLPANFDPREYFFISVFMIISWLPYFITYFPGTGTVDEIFMMRYPTSITNQPFFYNMVLNWFWKLGIIISHETWGLGLLNIIEQIVMASSLSYLLYWLRNRGLPRKYIYINILIFSFLPIFPNYAICLAKDKIFSSFFIFFFISVFEFFTTKGNVINKNKWKILFLVSSIMIGLRSNSIYVFWASSICMIIFYLYHHKLINKILILFLLIVTFCSSFSGFFLKYCYNQHNRFAEAIGIPLQQIARTIALNGLVTEKEKIFFNQILPYNDWKKLYHPFTIDTIKYNPSFNDKFLDSNKKEFLNYYISTFMDNKKIYMDSYLLSNYGFWAITKWNMSQTLFTTSLNRGSLNLKDPNEMITRGTKYSDNHLLSLRVKEKINNFNFKYNSYLGSGFCAWIYLFILLLLIEQKKYRFILGTLPILFCWGTILLAAPIAFAFRYTLFFAFLMPGIISLPFMKMEADDNEI